MTGPVTAERAVLLSAIRGATLAVKSATSASRFAEAMTRLQRSLHERRIERRFNPNWQSQPRVPRGTLMVGDGWTSVATDYEHRPVAIDLTHCRRTFERFIRTGAASPIANGCLLSTTSAVFVFNYSKKRAIPSATLSAAGDFDVRSAAGTFNSSAIIASNVEVDTLILVATVAGATAGQGAYLRSDDGIIDLSAEL